MAQPFVRAALVVALAVPAPAWASGLGQVRDPALAHLAREASQYLLRQQLANGGWSWQAGKAQYGTNAGGLIAEALLSSYEQSGDVRFLNSAQDYADHLLAHFAAHPNQLPYKPDVEFLVRMTEVGGNSRYAAAARDWFDVVRRTSPTGADEVVRIGKGRAADPDLVGFDVALGIRAALAVGAYRYARQLGDAVWDTHSLWLRDHNPFFATISRAALLDALRTTSLKRYAAAIASLSQQLRRAQDKNGSWCDDATQATAYAVRALAGTGDPASAAAAQRGSAWLASTLLPRGAWADYNDGLPPPFVGSVLHEVQAEALSAVILASRI